MPLMLPQEVAEQLTIKELTRLCGMVEQRYHQKFGVVDIVRNEETEEIVVTVELEDDTQRRIILD